MAEEARQSPVFSKVLAKKFKDGKITEDEVIELREEIAAPLIESQKAKGRLAVKNALENPQ